MAQPLRLQLVDSRSAPLLPPPPPLPPPEASPSVPQLRQPPRLPRQRPRPQLVDSHSAQLLPPPPPHPPPLPLLLPPLEASRSVPQLRQPPQPPRLQLVDSASERLPPLPPPLLPPLAASASVLRQHPLPRQRPRLQPGDSDSGLPPRQPPPQQLPPLPPQPSPCPPLRAQRRWRWWPSLWRPSPGPTVRIGGGRSPSPPCTTAWCPCRRCDRSIDAPLLLAPTTCSTYASNPTHAMVYTTLVRS